MLRKMKSQTKRDTTTLFSSSRLVNFYDKSVLFSDKYINKNSKRKVVE